VSLLVLPAGQSLRAVAEKLGVSVEELRTHAGVADVEAPLKAERRIEVPDGFLKSRTATGQLKNAVAPDSTRKGGMNAWLALDIEQKRTRAAGGIRSHQADSSEEEALLEARRTYLRFEADSNDLAIDMYNQITPTHSVDVRARAFAGMGCAYAQRRLLFGDTLERSQPQALSAAKAALWADPKLAQAHLAMALALETSGTKADLEEAKVELQKAVASGPEDPWCWAELGRVQDQLEEVDQALVSTAEALKLDGQNLFALETAASLSLRQDKVTDAVSLMTKAGQAVPTYANARLNVAVLMRRLGRTAESDRARDEALTLATRDAHHALLVEQLGSGQIRLGRRTG
jgi:tetratricopeptide (TPR) repeat protein